MNTMEKMRFDELYQKHLMMLENHGMRLATIDSYSRAVRRVSEAHDSCPDSLTPDQLKVYFNKLTKSHSWSTIKCDLSGLKFFWDYTLEKDWDWVTIVKPPQVKKLPDVLTIGEVETLLNSVRKIRYRVFLFTTTAWVFASAKPSTSGFRISTVKPCRFTSAMAKAAKTAT
jgi:site-specific recombinase XerD